MRNGWIAPNGRFYPCDYSGEHGRIHVELAYFILCETGEEHSVGYSERETLLIERGYVRCDVNFFIWRDKMTKEQRKTIREEAGIGDHVEERTIDFALRYAHDYTLYREIVDGLDVESND